MLKLDSVTFKDEIKIALQMKMLSGIALDLQSKTASISGWSVFF